MRGEQILTYKDAMYLVIGIEDGWIHCTKKNLKKIFVGEGEYKWKNCLII